MRMRLIVVALMLPCAVGSLAASPAQSTPTTTPGGASDGGGVFLTDVFSHRDSHRPQVDLNGVWGAPNDVFAVGNNGYILHTPKIQ